MFILFERIADYFESLGLFRVFGLFSQIGDYVPAIVTGFISFLGTLFFFRLLLKVI